MLMVTGDFGRFSPCANARGPTTSEPATPAIAVRRVIFTVMHSSLEMPADEQAGFRLALAMQAAIPGNPDEKIQLLVLRLSR
jgi:hypothetical protein